MSEILTYGSSEDVKYSFKLLDADPYVRFSYNGIVVQSQLPGIYNYNNLISAFAVGLHFDVPVDEIANALSNYTSDNNRSQIIHWHGHTVLKDAYNANPTSMEAALDNFVKMQHPLKVAILGHMLELGEYSKDEHQSLADKATSLGIDHICLVGSEFKDITAAEKIVKVPDAFAARKWLDGLNLKNALILLKGSRGIHLENVLI